MSVGDIDIDLQTSFNPDNIFNIVHASVVETRELKKHLVGVYFQHIPKDIISGFAAIPYNTAEQYGFIKLDMLHLSVLDIFNSKHEIKELVKREPDWKMLECEDVVAKCFHISNHGDLLRLLKPKSVSDLADVLAIIRPGKYSLVDKYIKDKNETRKLLYTKTKASDLRKSHAIPYALIIVLQLHLIKAGIL